jgi:hypothetical protein
LADGRESTLPLAQGSDGPVFELVLLDCAANATLSKEDDLLTDAARLCKIEAKRLRAAVAKDEQAKSQKKAAKTSKAKLTSK